MLLDVEKNPFDFRAIPQSKRRQAPMPVENTIATNNTVLLFPANLRSDGHGL